MWLRSIVQDSIAGGVHELLNTQIGIANPSTAQVSGTRQALQKAKEYGVQTLRHELPKKDDHLENNRIDITR